MEQLEDHDPMKTAARGSSSLAPQEVKAAFSRETPTGRRTKSRYGCRGCKSRRLKCDENKPECFQCIRRGRQCPGYARDFKFSDKHEKLRFDGSTSSQTRKRKRSGCVQEVLSSVETTKLAPIVPLAAKSGECGPKSDQQGTLESVYGSSTDSGLHDPVLAGSPSIKVSSRLEHGPSRSEKSNRSATPVVHALHESAARSAPQEAEMKDTFEDLIASPSIRDLSTSPQNKQRRLSTQLVQRTKSRIPNTPVDLPTTLIEYWFSHVCSMWSAYDSETNPNRQLALSTCFNSESVFYALQSMSAACLVDSLPHLKPVLASTSGNALAAINRDIEIYYDAHSTLDGALPTDLLLSIFAMATSLCWSDTKQLGEPLIVGARTILIRHQNDDGRSDVGENLMHFWHALKYTEMLLSFVSSESGHAKLEVLRSRHRKRLRQIVGWEDSAGDFKGEVEAHFSTFGPEKDSNFNDSSLHPWTGVSQKVQEQFSLVMTIVRDHHNRRTSCIQSARTLCEGLCDIEVARELASDLIRSEFSSETGGRETSSPLQTGDLSTPLAHLLDTAEAYRLSALLQLYIAFPDLEIRLNDTALTDELGDLTRDQALTTLTLLLVDVLQRIPADSGTRCIQPVLYVSAATGLRFDTPVTADPDLIPLTQCTIEVSRARQFIIDRLQTLLRSLPPRPISVALNLIKAIWAEYDYSRGGCSARHWMDVMTETGLQTLFG